MQNIPKKEDWENFSYDLDTKNSYEVFYGKNNKQAKKIFYDNVMEACESLYYMPKTPFKYYLISFRDFISENRFKPYESPDAVNCFLSLAENFLDRKPDFISESMQEILPTLEKAANNQYKYGAPESIYGSFQDKLSNIKELCKKNNIQLQHSDTHSP